MIPKDLLKKVRRIEITTQRLVTDVFAGQYHSVFKGQGIEFDEVREYQFGDEIRTIDWNVTARTGKPFVKKYVEERELTVMILVDVSRSCRFGTVNELKSQLAAEISALLALSAIRNNDKVGLIIFTDKIEKFIPPRKGRRHVLRVIREVLYFEPQGQSTNIVEALEYLSRVTTHKTISFLISDFISSEDNQAQNDLLRRSLSIANRRHDLIAVVLNDPKEFKIESSGILRLEDAETKAAFYLDTTDPRVRREYEVSNQKRQNELKRLFRMNGIDFIDITTDKAYADEFVKFFLKRRKRSR